MPVWLGAGLVAEEIITLREAAQKCGLSVSHLRLLARTGRLQARKIGRDWVTTLEAVDRYLKDEYLRSRSPYKSRKPRGPG
jgi:excisionase family DNA binding protein